MTKGRVALLVAGLLLLVGGMSWVVGTEGTGFRQSTVKVGAGEQFIPGKTLWDWMALLIVPLVLAVIAVLFSGAERENERRIADARLRDEVLQSYLDRMTQLLLDKDLQNNMSSQLAARVQTLVVLQRIDGRQKGVVLRFLLEAGLAWTHNPANALDLTGADFSNIQMPGANLSNLLLPKVNLIGANFENAMLEGSNFSNSNLSGANLKGAILSNAVFDGRDTKLINANMEQASLFCASLKSAKMEGCNLGQSIITTASFAHADLRGVIFDKARLAAPDFTGCELKKTTFKETRMYNEQWGTENNLPPPQLDLRTVVKTPDEVSFYNPSTGKTTLPVYHPKTGKRIG